MLVSVGKRFRLLVDEAGIDRLELRSCCDARPATWVLDGDWR